MKTQEQVLEAVKAGRPSQCLDGRDYSRLIAFFSVQDWTHFGFTLGAGGTVPPVRPWASFEIISQMRDDVAFGFVKALDQRGISAEFMYFVVKMWLWILDDPLEHMDQYAQYGLPLFRAVAIKYDFPNAINGDSGTESKYAANW